MEGWCTPLFQLCLSWHGWHVQTCLFLLYVFFNSRAQKPLKLQLQKMLHTMYNIIYIDIDIYKHIITCVYKYRVYIYIYYNIESKQNVKWHLKRSRAARPPLFEPPLWALHHTCWRLSPHNPWHGGTDPPLRLMRGGTHHFSSHLWSVFFSNWSTQPTDLIWFNISDILWS